MPDNSPRDTRDAAIAAWREELRVAGEEIQAKVDTLLDDDPELHHYLADTLGRHKDFLGRSFEQKLLKFLTVAQKLGFGSYWVSDIVRMFFELHKVRDPIWRDGKTLKKDRWAAVKFSSHPGRPYFERLKDSLEARAEEVPDEPIQIRIISRRIMTVKRDERASRQQTTVTATATAPAPRPPAIATSTSTAGRGERLLRHLAPDLPQPRPDEFYRLSPAAQAILDAIPLPIFFKDTAGEYQGGNEAWARFLGRPLARLLHREVDDVSPGPLAARYLEHDLKMFRNPGAPEHYSANVMAAGNTLTPVTFHKGTFNDPADGTLAGLVGVILDSTAEQRLHAELDRLKALSEGPGVGIVIHSSWVIRTSNDTCAEMFGYSSREELIDRHLTEFLAEGEWDALWRQVRSSSKGPYRVLARKAGGETFPVEIHSGKTSYAGERMLRAVITALDDSSR